MLYIKDQSPAQGSLNKPVFVFLHGLLGSGEDWQGVIDTLTDFCCLTIDLPGHGNSKLEEPIDFEHTCQLISQSVSTFVGDQRELVFIGYSLGARLAMFGLANDLFSELNVVGYYLEGGNFGLKDAKQRELRSINDRRWAERFMHEPLDQVLADWYQQPVFRSLDSKQREALILKRSYNDGVSVARMLMATSLSKQPYLLENIRTSHYPVHYLCGDQDEKFHEIAKQSQLPFTVITGTGHNVHKERPLEFSQVIRTALNFT